MNKSNYSKNKRPTEFISAKKYRTNDIKNSLSKAGFTPLDVMVTGVTGAGKSTTLNSLFEKTVAEVGCGVDPMTMSLDSYCLNNHIRFWDTPGLGDSVKKDILHERNIIDLLYETYGDSKQYGFIDIALIVIEGSNRDMGTTYHLLNNVILPNIQADRVVVAINQADMAMKGRNWNKNTNSPQPELIRFLDQQATSIQQRIKQSCGISINKPVYYSAEYNYNIQGFMDAIIAALPENRRELILD